MSRFTKRISRREISLVSPQFFFRALYYLWKEWNRRERKHTTCQAITQTALLASISAGGIFLYHRWDRRNLKKEIEMERNKTKN
ncbi:hypothetical protein AALP_AA3G035900 [Arabis alpina]|uniref:Uncharacterized protein n=1 Tax=Arabis alpina TaxID=50452 RepID=A0A087H6T7_ARAAL|nr:hypothetical protein AALP_AA3G035900 [Arabis alpina]